MNKTPEISTKLTNKILITAACLAAVVIFTVLIHAASKKSVLGADFYTFWMAAKALFLEHTNPYSAAVTEQIQWGKLGRLASPGEDQMAFAYPPYSLLAVLPTILLPFDWASSIWLVLNITTFTFILFLQPASARLFLLTSFLFFPTFLNLVLGTFDIIAASGILLFFSWIAGQNRTSRSIQIITGILLAWATIKPQFTWLLLGFALIYSLREKYLPLLLSFLISVAVFFALSFTLVPNWPVDWIHQVQKYTQYVQGRPTITEFLLVVLEPDSALVITGIFFLIFTGIAFILLLRWWNGKLHWLKVTAWLGMMTYLFHLHGISYEQLIFIFPLILWVAFREKWNSPTVLFFWGTSLFISWLGFSLGINSIVIDRSPLLFNLVWVGWLLRKPCFQL